MIDTVVFDVGGVLADFRYMDYMRDLGFSQQTADFLAEHMVRTEFWREWDLGLRTAREGEADFARRFPVYEREIHAFWADMTDLVREYDYALPLVRRVKAQGCGVYLLSNYPVETARLHWPRFRFLPETDGRIVSGFERLAKPDPAIYRLLESRFGLRLENCLFVDDSPANVEAARGLGMTAVRFTGPGALEGELAALLPGWRG